MNLDKNYEPCLEHPAMKDRNALHLSMRCRLFLRHAIARQIQFCIQLQIDQLKPQPIQQI